MLRKSLSYDCRKHFSVLLFAPVIFSFQSTMAANNPVSSKPLRDTTIFQATDAPTAPAVDDGMPIELGVKFRSAQNGHVNGIRFYKGAAKGGKYLVHLWSATGSKLGEAAFTGDSAIGWKEVLFEKPVEIKASTTYIAAYFSGPGDYASTNPYFTKGVVNGPLRALANGDDGPNGVYKYADAPAFPEDNYGSNNYWVDVLFIPDANAPVAASPAATATATAEAPVKDTLPPQISNVHTAPNPDGSVAVTWTTNENADAAVRYDVSPDSLTLHMEETGLATSHKLQLTKLTPGITYYFRILSKDAAGNTVVKPTIGAPPLSFKLPEAPCAIDKAPEELNAGTPDVGTLITADGAVTLQPMVSEEFASALTTIPAGWKGARYNTDGTTVNNKGVITVSGTHMYSENTYEPGSSIEFAATFTEGNYQNIGFSIDEGFNNGPWVMVGEAAPDGNLYARASNNTAINLGTRLFDTQHRFQIKWNPGGFEFYIDGDTKPAAVINMPVKTNMFIQVSDYVASDNNLSIDWMHVAPYALTGSFTSRVFDAGDITDWGAITWHGDTPAGTSISMAISTGNTADPNDGSWTSFKPINAQGESVAANSRFIQYKATLKTTDNKVTPVLKGVAINCKGNGRMREQVKEALKPANSAPKPGTGLSVKVMPNPSSDYFELATTTGNTDKTIILNVLDSYGRIVEHHQGLPPNGTFQFGQSLSPGTYFTEVLQGATRKTVKIVKVK